MRAILQSKGTPSLPTSLFHPLHMCGMTLSRVRHASTQLITFAAQNTSAYAVRMQIFETDIDIQVHACAGVCVGVRVHVH